VSADQVGPASFDLGDESSIPHEVVEGILAEGIAEVKNAMDDIYENLSAGTFSDCVVANMKAITLEMGNTVSLLSSQDRSGMRPKHRAAVAIFQEFLRRLGDNDLTLDSSAHAMARFARDAVTFLECVHMCMHENTGRQKRHYWKKRFLNG